MKETFTFTITLLALALTLTACGGYTPDRSYMTEEQVQYEEKQLTEATAKYNSATDSSAKVESASSIAFRNMNLGNYKEAIEYYKLVLESDSANFPALNNLAVMYEEMGDLDNAIKYQGELYNSYTDNAEVNSDFIRLLLANKQLVEAGRVVEAYKLTEKGAANVEFAKSLEKSIEDAAKKAEQ